jgi:hypothetical protein
VGHRAAGLRIVRSLRSNFWTLRERLALKAATRSARQQSRRGDIAEKFKGRAQIYGEAVLNPSIKRSISETRGTPPPEKKDDPDFELTPSGGRKYREFAIDVHYHDDAGKLGQRGIDFKMPEWSRLRTILHRAHAYVRAAVRLPAFFEHLAPLAIAAAAIALPLILKLVDCP